MKTCKLFVLFLTASAATVSYAQAGRAGEGALQAIRKGTAAVALNPRALPRAVTAHARLAEQSAVFRTQYAQAAQAAEQAAKNMAKPVELSYGKKPVVIGTPSAGTAPVARRKVALTAAKRQQEEVMYNWGEALDKANALGYRTAPLITVEDETVLLTINRNTAVIRSGQANGSETVITPVEIGVNALTLKSAAEVFTPDMLAAVFAEDPAQAAGFFYLHENFKNSLAQFQAASDAFNMLPTGRFKSWLRGNAKQTQLVHSNYDRSAANLAVDTAYLLKFMSMHTEVFSSALESYGKIMRLHNANAHTPSVFQNFWNQPTSI